MWTLFCFFSSLFDRFDMIKSIKLYKTSHTVYITQYHIVCIIHYRWKILILGVKSYLKINLLELRIHYQDWECLEIGIYSAHIHLYILIPLKYDLTKVVEAIKSITAEHWNKNLTSCKRSTEKTNGSGRKDVLF